MLSGWHFITPPLFTFLCSCWESVHRTLVLSIMPTIYTWASGLYAAIFPDFLTCVDTLLALWTMLHMFVALSYVAVSDAFYKKQLLQAHYQLIQPIHDAPLLLPILNTALASFVAHLVYSAFGSQKHGDNHDDKATLRAIVALYSWACSIFLQKMSKALVKLGVDYAMKVEKDMEQHDIETWTIPPKWTANLCWPQNLILRPEIYNGAKKTAASSSTADDETESSSSSSPGLYVMNHALYGVEMAPFVATMFQAKNVFLRGLSDHFHFGNSTGKSFGTLEPSMEPATMSTA